MKAIKLTILVVALAWVNLLPAQQLVGNVPVSPTPCTNGQTYIYQTATKNFVCGSPVDSTAIHPASALTTVGAIPTVSSAGALGQSLCTIDASNNMVCPGSISAGGWLYPTIGPKASRTPGIVLFGDSVTAEATAVCTSTYYPDNNSPCDSDWFAWSEIGSKQRFPTVVNAGVGGDTTTGMLARISTDVLAQPYQYVFVLGGGNDLVSGVPATTVIANLLSIYDQIRANGQRLIISSLYPSSNYTTAVMLMDYSDICAFSKSYAASHLDVIFADLGAATRTSMANPVPIAGTVDGGGVHLVAYGAALMGRAFRNAILSSQNVPAAATLMATNGGGILPNGIMSGTGGTTSGGATGTVADSWVLYSLGGATSVVGSKVMRSDGGPGSWQQVVHTGLALGQDQSATSSELYTSVNAPAFSAGQTITAYVEWEADNNWQEFEFLDIKLAFINSGFGVIKYQRALYAVAVPTYPETLNLINGVYKFPPTVVPAGAISIEVHLYYHGAVGTYRIGRVQINAN